ncbi:MAG: DUF2630 family protein [Streptosporangiales bacterium]|nr:DUF2630 family protein [Streptosporangiales bacterium]
MSTPDSGDAEVLGRISELVNEERELRGQAGAGGLGESGRSRLRALERNLDQCWDLLRQRRAREEFGENPDDAAVRPASEVEGYRQ